MLFFVRNNCYIFDTVPLCVVQRYNVLIGNLYYCIPTDGRLILWEKIRANYHRPIWKNWKRPLIVSNIHLFDVTKKIYNFLLLYIVFFSFYQSIKRSYWSGKLLQMCQYMLMIIMFLSQNCCYIYNAGLTVKPNLIVLKSNFAFSPLNYMHLW